VQSIKPYLLAAIENKQQFLVRWRAPTECRMSAHAGDAKRGRKSGQVLGSNVGNEVFYGALYYGLKVPPGTAACPHETRA
jgi:hypothetical protein